MAEDKVKLSKKMKFRVNKEQRRLKVGNLSNHWPKDHPNKNSSIGTLDN